MMTWKQYLARLSVAAVALGAGVFVAVRAANATQGGQTRHALTVAGTLTGVTGTPTLSFTLRKGTTTCPATARNVVLNGTTFSAEVPLDGCPAFFDGSDVTVDVSVNGTPVVSGSAVNPVPYARYADQYGTPDCPVGYEREIDPSEGFSEGSATRICRRCRGPGRFENCYDDVVRVGVGPSAFWIDRYEASVWGTETALPGSIRGASDGNDYDERVPDNGQYSGVPLFARSHANVPPARRLTWFQANEFCAASGKRLPSGPEWLLAARGTPDPGAMEGDGRDRRCITNLPTVQVTGGRSPAPGVRVGCQSVWGAQDMIGNLAEWTSEWYLAPGTAGIASTLPEAWGSGYGSDSTRGVASNAFAVADLRRIPSATLRGGGYLDGANAGIFSLSVSDAPSANDPLYGFRCVIPR